MRNLLTYFIFIFITCISMFTYAQSENMKGYRIDGEDVIFTFDLRDYDKATSHNRGQLFDFEDLDIKTVAVSGEFNNWSLRSWKMTKISEYLYVLKKSIRDFSDEFSWEFKFVINKNYWAEPSEEHPNIVEATRRGYHLNSYNLKMFTNLPDKEGNTTFRLKGHPEAKKVMLAGTFNKWNTDIFVMDKTSDGWELTLQLNPGKYEYKFIVDGEWTEDPDNPDKSINEHGTINSCIDIKKDVNFQLIGHLDARKIILAGSFNNWSEDEYLMDRTEKGWIYTLPLSAGKHTYKFIVDGRWILDPVNTIKEYDFNGNINSICFVK